MEMPWAAFACKKLSAKQTNWIVAQTMSFSTTQRCAPLVVLKKEVAKTAGAIVGESRWMAIDVIGDTPKMLISAHHPHERLPLEQFTATLEE